MLLHRISFTCLCYMLIASAHAQDIYSLKDQVPHITITGSAHAEVAPDIAIISFAVVTERPTATAAASDNATAAQAVIGEVKAQGIEGRDIRTVSSTLSPIYDESRDANGHLIKRTLRAYQARNGFEVRIRALDKAGSLAGQLIEKGANNFGGVSFEIEHPETRLIGLQGEATRDAVSRAQSYVSSLGLKLGRVIEIVPGGREMPYPTSPRAKFAMAAAASEPPPPVIPMEPGVQTLESSVTVTWELMQ